MPAIDLTQAEMSLVTERLLDEHIDLLQQTHYLEPLIEPTRSLMQAFIDDQIDPQAEVREAAAIVQGHVQRFNDQIWALDHFLTGFALLEDEPERRAAIEAAHREVLPDGRQIINRTVGDKAAEARLMGGRLRGDAEALLDNLRVGDMTLNGFIRRDFMGTAEALGDAQAERLAAESRASRRARGYNLVTRRRFLQLEATLRNLLDLNGAPDTLRETLLGFVDRLIRQAERRAAQRRNHEGQPLPAPALDPVLDAGALADLPADDDPAPDAAPADRPAGGAPAADAPSSGGGVDGPAADRGGSSSDTSRRD